MKIDFRIIQLSGGWGLLFVCGSPVGYIKYEKSQGAGGGGDGSLAHLEDEGAPLCHTKVSYFNKKNCQRIIKTLCDQLFILQWLP